MMGCRRVVSEQITGSDQILYSSANIIALIMLLRIDVKMHAEYAQEIDFCLPCSSYRTRSKQKRRVRY